MNSGLERPGPDRRRCGALRALARAALALARTLARAVGTRLILVAVYPVDARSATMARGAYAQALAEEAESALEWMARPLAGVLAESRAVPVPAMTAITPRGGRA